MAKQVAPIHNIDGRDQDNGHNYIGAYSQTGGFDPEYRPAPRANTHPCVKPQSLVSWICRLLTKPGDLVLDPFLGSGTTALACLHDGRRCIGIEREPEYHRIAEARVQGARAAAATDCPLFAADANGKEADSP